MPSPRANHLRLVPEVRQDAPRIFRDKLHALARSLAMVPATGNEPVYVSLARGLVHAAQMEGHARARIVRHLEKQLIAELLAALPAKESGLEILTADVS